MGEKFFFIFGEQPTKRVFVDEPIGYTGVPFILQKQDDGMGLDVSLNGDENRFTLTDQRDHQLPEMVYYRDRYGFQANVKFGIIFENGEELISQVDAEMSTTDDFSYFEFSTITESSKQVFKRHMSTKVDMFSSLGINGEFIDPLVPINMLLQAKPSVQVSKWQKPTSEPYENTPGVALSVFNPGQSLIQADIKDSYTFFQDKVFANSISDGIELFKIIKADSNLKGLKLVIKNIESSTIGTSILRLYVAVNNTATRLMEIVGRGSFNNDITYYIDQLQREDTVSLFWLVQGGARVDFDYFELTAESTAYNSIVPSFRLIDVMKQIAKSTANLEIFAPRYNIGGEFYDTVLTNGKMLGGNITDPFYISWEDLMNSVKGEGNAGFEISLDGKVFVGTEDDFYTDTECGIFEDIQFNTLKKETDPKLSLNTFKLNFSNYQSLKENTEPNSGSTIHGESILTLPNTEVEGDREIKIPWIRDAILLDVQQRLSTIVSKDTATQDDDKIFAIDTIETENDQQFQESTELQHTANIGYLSLKSNGSVNFLVLGIKPNTTFQILLPDTNAGSYTVSEVFNTEIRLISSSPNPTNNGVRLTKYIYEIKQATIPLTNRTNQGFGVVENLISPEKYSNMRYSVERIIRTRYEKLLSACNLWSKKDIINTYYKNNGACITEYNGLYIQEKENFTPAIDPIYNSNWYEGITFANVDFEEFVALCNRLRTYHGFITMKDVNRRLLKIYPTKLSYQNDTRAITMDGNEKFIKAYLTITNAGGNIIVNKETTVTVLKWDLIDHKVELFDLERQRLYQGVYWYKCSINGAIASTLSEFEETMNLIGEKFDSTAF